jgi:hypothetical protein
MIEESMKGDPKMLPGVREAIQAFITPEVSARMLQLADAGTDRAHNKLRQSLVTLDEKSRTTFTQGYGTVAAIPGAKFAYFQGEERNSRMLLVQPNRGVS